MGQATVDLPDPLDPAATTSSEAPVSPASADDLLAQLAGEEIDRLLAEADAERPTLADRAAAAKFAGMVTTEKAPAAQPPVVPAPPARPTAAPAKAALAEATQAAGDTSDELDALFNQIEASDRTAPQPAAPTTAPVVAPAVAPVVASTAEPQREMTADEIAAAILAEPPAGDAKPESGAVDAPAIEALAAQVAAAEIDAAASASGAASTTTTTTTTTTATTAATIADLATGAAEAAALRDDAAAGPVDELLLEDEGNYTKPTLLVRLLELFNVPFAALPESFREALGKIAILTLFNSLAVLAYVLLFRRHH